MAATPLKRTAEPFPHTIEMTPEEWIAVPDNPRQRDTERRLATRSAHLRSGVPTLVDVAMAVLPDGSRVKLDGHTRALLWAREPGYAPPTVYVRAYLVASLEEALALYPTFDSKEAMETNADKASGALRAAGITPAQPFLKKGTFSQGLEWADAMLCGSESGMRNRGPSVYELVAKWRPEIEALDALPPIKLTRMNAPLFAAALLTLRRRPERAAEFWSAYAGDRGTKIDNEIDGVEAVNWLFGRMRNKTNSVRVGYVSRVVSAFEMWHRDRAYSMKTGTGPKTTNMQAYLAPLRRA